MMKKIFGYAMVAAILAVPIMTFAAEFRTGDQPSIQASEQIANDIYIAGGSVTSFGIITGDLVAGGGNIVISGNVGADVTAGGGNVSILSNVGDDVRAVGGNIVVQGRIGGDLLAGGGQITVSGAGVGGDVAIGGGDIRIEAPVGGKLTVGAGSVFINAPISGDIMIEADVVKLGSNAVISGNLKYKANRELVKADGAVINGKVVFEPKGGKMVPGLAAIVSAFLLWKFFALLACSLVIGLVFRRYVREMLISAEKRPFYEIGRGLIILIALPVISVLLCVTLVGVPLGILGFLFFAVGIIVAWIATPIIIGSFVHRYFSKKDLEISWKTILIGVVVYTLIGIVPFIGWIVQKLLVLLALGAADTVNWQMLKNWR